MTKQITIKLNEAKFKPILDMLVSAEMGRNAKTYSELAGKCIWFCHYFGIKKFAKFGNKTQFQMMAQMNGLNIQQAMADAGKHYAKFLKTGKL